MGQPRVLSIVRRLLQRAVVPHALLFTGIEGVGKRTTAHAFAMALNCRAADNDRGEPADQDFCGRCAECRRIAGGSHPDILQVNPQKGILRIDQIREVLATLALKPFSARRRVVIFADAHTLNPEAGNALLKVLEEPPDGSVLILTARQRSDLLPTIVSRCRHIRFSPLAAETLAEMLIGNRGLAPQQAAAVAQAAEGSYTKALALADNHWERQRDWVIGAIGLDRAAPPEEGRTTMALAYAAGLARSKDLVEARLEMLKTWLRDLSVRPYAPRGVINQDRADALDAARARLDDRRLLALWDAVEQAHKNIAANGNLRLTLDVMALRMADLLAA